MASPTLPTSALATSALPTPASTHLSSQSSSQGCNPGLRRPAGSLCSPTLSVPSSPRSSENDHQLEKLEFALAVAITRGDATRAQALREQIAALGGNSEEPGT